MTSSQIQEPISLNAVTDVHESIPAGLISLCTIAIERSDLIFSNQWMTQGPPKSGPAVERSSLPETGDLRVWPHVVAAIPTRPTNTESVANKSRCIRCFK